MKSDWKNYKIGEFAKRSKIPTKVADSILYKRLTIRMHGLGIVLRDEISGSLIGTKNQFFAKGGQFLLSKIDARNGAFGILSQDLDGALISNSFQAYDLDKNIIDIDYFNYFTKTHSFIDFCNKASEGTTNRRNLDDNKFLSFEIPLPSLPEQKRIVKKIKEIEERTKSIISTEDYIEKAVNAIVPSALSKIFSDEDWKKDKIGNLIDEIKTGTTPPSGEQKYFKEELNWFTPSDFKGQMYLDNSYRKISQLAIDDGKVKIYKVGTVLFIGIGATLGKVGILKNEATSNQQITGIRFKKNILPEFVYYWFKANYSAIRGLCPATTLPILNQDKIKKLVFSFPESITEQQKIIDHLNLIENKKEEIKKERSKQFLITTALMPSVLAKAFNGEL